MIKHKEAVIVDVEVRHLPNHKQAIIMKYPGQLESAFELKDIFTDGDLDLETWVDLQINYLESISIGLDNLRSRAILKHQLMRLIQENVIGINALFTYQNQFRN